MGISRQMAGRKALESAFRVSRTSDDRSNVTGELVDVKVSDPVQAEFSEQVSFKLTTLQIYNSGCGDNVSVT